MLKLPTQVRKVGSWLARQTRKLTKRQIQVSIGAVGAVSLSMVLLAIAQSPKRPPQQTAVAGQRLFETILGEHQSIRHDSRIKPAENRGSSMNRLVFPDAVWESMTTEQRNSLGMWLNSIGGRWEIRAGSLANDGNRVSQSKAVITSRLWNQQTK